MYGLRRASYFVKMAPVRASAWSRLSRSLSVLVLLLSAVDTANAQSPYQLKSGREWTLLGAGAALGISGVALMEEIEPFTEAELAALSTQDINSFDRSGMEPYRGDAAGDVLKYASFALPLTLLADQRTRQDWKTLGLMWGEVLLLESGLTAMTKGLIERARPYAYDPQAPTDLRTSRDAKISFFSGHTSTTAATCFFLAKVYSDYPFSKTTKTIAWSAAAIYPAVVGFLRVDSGHHFRTDVIAGYLVGAAVGYLVPVLHRTLSDQGVAPYQTRSGGLSYVGVTFAF